MNPIPAVDPQYIIDVTTQHAQECELHLKDSKLYAEPDIDKIAMSVLGDIATKEECLSTLVRLYAFQHFRLANSKLLKPWLILYSDPQSIDESLFKAAARAPIRVTGPRMSQHTFETSTFMAILLEETEAGGRA